MDVACLVVFKMKQCGASSLRDSFRFNLLALVGDEYQMASNDLEVLKKEERALERRMIDVSPVISESSVFQIVSHIQLIVARSLPSIDHICPGSEVTACRG
jgi:hypothetical protein